MLPKNYIEDVLYAALETGGDFAEIFLEHTEKSSISMLNGKVEKALSGIDYGLGIRIFNGLHAVYAYTNDTSYENLIRVAKEAAAAIQKTKKDITINLEKKRILNGHPIIMMPQTIASKEKVAMLRKANETASGYDSLITQVRTGYLDTVQNVLIANSDGLWAEDQRVRTRFTLASIASEGNEKQSGSFNPGEAMGFEFFDTIDVEEGAKEASRIAVTMLKADLCPSGNMPVVMDNGFGGVIFHEACGHGLEATSVAKNASVYAGKLGQPIASPIVTAVDDGTIKNAWGSSNIDDEGTPTQKNVLIENGILKSYMIDKLNGKKMGMKSTGSARRESYRYAPTSRMTNTFIAAGKSNPEQIIADTEYGLYAKYMGGGSVNPSTGEFNFAVTEGYMIRNGKIAEPVRGATLIGKGHEVLMKIDRVGKNLSLSAGMCGSISGSIPAHVGQPMVRVSEITVGGRKEA